MRAWDWGSIWERRSQRHHQPHWLSPYTAPTKAAIPPKGSWEFGAKNTPETIVKCLQPARHPAKSVSYEVLLRQELFSPLNGEKTEAP